METRNLQEINPTDTDIWLTVGLESSGQEAPDWRIYLEKDASDDETQVFYMVFNVIGAEQEDASLSLIFKELDGTKDSKTELVNITVPESESIPSLTWKNENSEQQLALTSYDMLITNQGASDVEPEYDEISVKMKDGSTYVIESKSQRLIDMTAKALRANDAHSHEKKLLLRNRARRGQERSVIRNSKRVSVREHTFL